MPVPCTSQLRGRALRGLTETLSTARTPDALIGGVAVQFYTQEPRTTVDVNVALASYDGRIPDARRRLARASRRATRAGTKSW